MENLLNNLKSLLQKDERLVSLPAKAHARVQRTGWPARALRTGGPARALRAGGSAQAGEGEILKNKVIELALKLDKELIKLLLSDEKMKEVFLLRWICLRRIVICLPCRVCLSETARSQARNRQKRRGRQVLKIYPLRIRKDF